MDLLLFRLDLSRYSAGTPNQHRQTNRMYRQMRIGAAERIFFGTTTSVFSRMDTAAFLAQNSLTATARRCFQTEPTFGIRATTVCSG